MEALFHPSRIERAEGFNRWQLVPVALSTHVCLGSVYAWSIFNEPVAKGLGVVSTAADDWSMSLILPSFSIVLALQGFGAAILGKWLERVGPRVSGVGGAICFGSGFMLAGAGATLHSLPLFYIGSFCSGMGLGLAYVPPLAMLLRWFPDRRGMATGLAGMGFGGGALASVPFMRYFMERFSVAPEYAGSLDTVRVVTENARRYVADAAGQLREVVVVAEKELATSGFPELDPGAYFVGTGSTGVGTTMALLGAAYLAIMLPSALAFRVPKPGFVPGPKKAAKAALEPQDTKAGGAPATASDDHHQTAKSSPAAAPSPAAALAGLPPGARLSEKYVHIDDVMKTPQFWQLWMTFGCTCTAGLAMLSMAMNMVTDIFGTAMPLIVTSTFASGYVMALSGANLTGRLVWSTASDYLGRKKTFFLFSLVSVPLYLVLPSVIGQFVDSPNMLPLGVFCASTLVIISFLGGAYVVTPPFEADLFGTKYVAAVHGRVLTASATGSIIGPQILAELKRRSTFDAIQDLAAKVDPALFVRTFGESTERLSELVAAKTVTIPKLMLLMPEGTQDPTPFLYDTALYGASGLLAVALLANAFITPIGGKYVRRDIIHADGKITPLPPGQVAPLAASEGSVAAGR